MKPATSNQFDLIIIGSGIGALTVGTLYAQIAKKRVLILESHFKLGGFTHSFRRKKFEWDVGVHYIGEMYPKALSRKVMDCVTDRQVEWHEIEPIFERFCFPQGTFDVPKGPKAYLERLIEWFPDEAANLKKYFQDVKKTQGWIARWFMSKQYHKWIASCIAWPGKKLAVSTTGDYLARFKDPLLRAILAAQWPDFGTPPGKSAFAFHAAVASDFFHGGFYPIGGASRIAESAEKVIEKHGGQCLVSHAVSEILVEKGKACGVRVTHKGKELEFRAPKIVSNASTITTFDKLVPDAYCHEERAKARRQNRGTSASILFLGLKDDPRKFGFDQSNYWMYPSTNHDRDTGTDPRVIHGGFLSFCSLRQPDKQAHTAQIVTFSPYASWQKWAEEKWQRRGDEYDALKEEVADNMLTFVEQFAPGIKNLVEYRELSTPLSVEAFTGHPGGMIYGPHCDHHRITDNDWSIKTSLPNLFLAGSDVGSPGVNGSMMASLFTAAKLLGPFGLMKVFTHIFSR